MRFGSSLRGRPIVQLAFAGGVLLFVVRLLASQDPAPAAVEASVVISAEQVQRLLRLYEDETGLTPTPDDEVALIEGAIDEELLLREAFARGLQRNDRSVRGWLVEQMRALGDGAGASDDELHARAIALGLEQRDPVVRRLLVHKVKLLVPRVDEDDAGDDELRAHHARRADAFRSPVLTTLWQIYLRPGGGGPAADAVRAARLLDDLRTRDVAPQDAAMLGDAFPTSSRLVARSPQQLETLFGPRFAAEAATTVARTWSGPLTSPYGLHLLWVEERTPDTEPAFDDVRSRVRESWREEQRAVRLATLLRDLRGRHAVRVESAAWRARRGA